MARLSAKQRDRLPGSAFVYPSRKVYPIHDVRHARLALAMAARKDSFGDLATVRRAVYRKYPELDPRKKNRS